VPSPLGRGEATPVAPDAGVAINIRFVAPTPVLSIALVITCWHAHAPFPWTATRAAGTAEVPYNLFSYPCVRACPKCAVVHCFVVTPTPTSQLSSAYEIDQSLTERTQYARSRLKRPRRSSVQHDGVKRSDTHCIWRWRVHEHKVCCSPHVWCSSVETEAGNCLVVEVACSGCCRWISYDYHVHAVLC
jgi:hypothetical protein